MIENLSFKKSFPLPDFTREKKKVSHQRQIKLRKVATKKEYNFVAALFCSLQIK